MAKRDADQLGDLGEIALQKWATQAGIAINKANKDKTGWDYILEFPPLADPTAKGVSSLDQRPSPMKCFIQVKSTDRKPGSWQVSLSNWEYLIKNPLPAFFLVCEFDESDEPQRAYLVHIDKSYIYLVQKRLRKLSAEGITAIHKKKLNFVYDESNRLIPLHGSTLVNAIRSHAGYDLAEYSKNKSQDVQSVGYEEESFSISVTIDLPDKYSSDPLEFLVNQSLGLIPKLDIKYAEIKDRRFGIEVPGQSEIMTGGEWITDPQSVATATIVFSAAHRIKDLRVETKVFVPQGLDIELSEEYQKIRFSAPFIDLIARRKQYQGRLTFRLPPTNRYPLKELWQVSELITMYHEAIEMGASFNHELIVHSERVAKGSLIPKAEDAKFTDLDIHCAKSVINAWTVTKYLDIQDQIQVSIVELLAQSTILELLASVIEGRPVPIGLDFSMSQTDASTMGAICCPIIPRVDLGEQKVFLGLAILGEAIVVTDSGTSSDVGRYTLKTDHPVIHGAITLPIDQRAKPYLRGIHERIIKTYEATYDTLTVDNVHAYLNDDESTNPLQVPS